MKKVWRFYKKWWDSMFFPRSNAWELNTNLIPRAYSPFKMADWTQAKITARYKKVVSTVFFFISLSLYGTSIPRKYSIFIQQLNLFHFRKIFPKNLQKPVRLGALSWDREKWQKIARLTAEPWELAGLCTVFCETSSSKTLTICNSFLPILKYFS